MNPLSTDSNQAAIRHELRPTKILYLASGTDSAQSPALSLEDHHDLVYRKVHTIDSLEAYLGQEPRLFDCVVLVVEESGTNPAAIFELISRCDYETPIIVHDKMGGEIPPSKWVDAGVDEYIAPTCGSGLPDGMSRVIEQVSSDGAEVGRPEDENRRPLTMPTWYRGQIDGAPDPILTADVDTGTIVEANDTAAELLRRPREELIGIEQTELHPPEDREKYRELFERHVETGQSIFNRLPSGDLIYVQTGDGERIPVEINAKLIEMGDRRLFQGNFRDISDRIERNRSLRCFQKAIEQAGHTVMITNRDGEIEYVNPAFEEASGFTASEVIGERPSILKSGEHDEQFYRDLWETIRSGEVWEGEIINKRGDGSRYHIEQTIAPVEDQDGEIERFVAINKDISEQKLKEYQLERERNRLEEFARTIAHDLRNPLSIGMGHLELFLKSCEQPSSALCTAFEAMERMDEMINELLTLSKRGKVVHETEQLSIAQTAKKAWEHVLSPDASLEIGSELAEEMLEANETRLVELFENLFSNAVKHAGPHVQLKCGLMCDERGFFVADDGPGIDEENWTRVFESGFTTSSDGTGYGLSIVKQIVDAHGWEISAAESESGGARFEVVTGTHGVETAQRGETYGDE